MSFWVLCLLCVVQGLAEFLPISSSGHLLLVEQIFGVSGDVTMLNLFLHLSTLLAVVVVYRKTLVGLLKKPFQPLTFKLAFATVLTVALAGLYEVFNFERFEFKVYGFCFLLTALVLFVVYQFKKKSTGIFLNDVSWKAAGVVGVVQGLAVLPGLSRSGSTIAALMFCGINEKQAGEFSFLLSIPVIVGGFIFEILKIETASNNVFAGIGFAECVFAFVLTFVVAYASLKITLKLLNSNKFVWFSVYLTVIALVAILLNLCF